MDEDFDLALAITGDFGKACLLVEACASAGIDHGKSTHDVLMDYARARGRKVERQP